MTSIYKFEYLFAFAFVLCAALCSALDEESVKERSCIKVSVAKNLDLDWVG